MKNLFHSILVSSALQFALGHNAWRAPCIPNYREIQNNSPLLSAFKYLHNNNFRLRRRKENRFCFACAPVALYFAIQTNDLFEILAVRICGALKYSQIMNCFSSNATIKHYGNQSLPLPVPVLTTAKLSENTKRKDSRLHFITIEPCALLQSHKSIRN